MTSEVIKQTRPGAPLTHPQERIDALRVLLYEGWTVTKIAVALGINRQHVHRIIKREGLRDG